MQVPILKQGPFLIATIQSALTDADIVELRDALVAQVGKSRSRGVIIDVTALDVMDSFATAISELARNILLYAKRGEIILVPIERGERRGLFVVAHEVGPGIPEVTRV